jgi:hypothetical protein
MARRNLTPQEMAAAASQGIPYQTADGQWVIPQMMNTGGSAGSGAEGASQVGQSVMGYGMYDPSRMNVGDAYGSYDTQGQYQGENTFAEESDNLDMLLAGLAVAGGMHFLLPGAAGAAGGGGSAAGSLAGDAFMPGNLSLSNFAPGAMGPVTASEAAAQTAALHSSLAPYAATGAAGAAGGAAGASAMGPVTAGEAAAQNAGLASSLAPYAAPAGAGALSGLGKLAGPAAAIAGGLLGAQGQDGATTQERKLDPRMDKFIYGDLFPRAQGLLGQQMPQAQQVGDQMRNAGMGLLNMPMAGNGFSMFYGSK